MYAKFCIFTYLLTFSHQNNNTIKKTLYFKIFIRPFLILHLTITWCIADSKPRICRAPNEEFYTFHMYNNKEREETLVIFRPMCTATAGDGCDVPEMQARVCVHMQTFAVNYGMKAISKLLKYWLCRGRFKF